MKIRALIAEDVAVMRKLIKNALAVYDCDVVAEVDNGCDVVQKILEVKPDLVFLDINMPGRNGLDILQELKQSNSALFVAIVSGENSFENIKKSLEIGANSFVVKPFTNSKLKEVIDKYHSQAA